MTLRNHLPEESQQPLVESVLSDLVDLVDDQERVAFFGLYSEHRTRETVEQLSEEVVRLQRVDLVQASKVAATIRWLADQLDDEYCRGRGHRAGGNVSYLKGQYKEALGFYELALRSFERVGAKKQAAITRSSALHTLVLLGEYERAFDWAKGARQTFEELGDALRLARLEGNFGNILFRQDRWQEAAEHFRAAYEKFLQIGESQDVAICLRNMAVCHASLNDFKEALKLYEKARTYCEENKLPGLVGEIDYNIASLHYLRGEYTLAIQLYRNTRARCEELGDRYHTALCDLDQSEIFLELNLVREAGDLAQQALASFDQIEMHYEAAKALAYLAIARSREGKSFLAIDLLSKAREVFVRERNQVWPALIDLYEALVLQRAGRPLEAARLAEGALAGFLAISLPTKAMMCEVLLARLYLENGDLGKARSYCEELLIKLDSMDMPTVVYQTYFVLGQVEEASRRPADAIMAYQRAHNSLELFRGRVRAEELKISFLEDKLSIYESLVCLSLQRGEEEKEEKKAVFYYIEAAKSRSLADLISFRVHALPATSGTRSDQAEQVRKLREELNWYYRQIDLQEMSADNRSREEVQQLREISHRREDHLLKTLRELQKTDQEFSSLQEATTVDMKLIQSSLPHNAQLVEYYVARGIIYACILTSEDLEILPITVVSRAEESHKALHFQLSKFRLGEDYVAEFSDLITEATETQLRDLYVELIEPIRSRLNKEHLIIVPHGFLYRIPFHALFDGKEFLIDQFIISYAPSATVYYLCRTKNVASANESLVLGAIDPSAARAVAEVEAAAAALPGSRLFVGPEATEEVLRLHGESSRFLFILAQGQFRNDNPMFSALHFSASELSFFDLYNLKLAAELVVLRGCGTGLQGGETGDALVGLVRGLLYAGARAVLTTLWDTEDDSSILFTRSFCRSLQRNRNKARALREALQEVRHKYPQPYHWAPYLLIGEASEGVVALSDES